MTEDHWNAFIELLRANPPKLRSRGSKRKKQYMLGHTLGSALMELLTEEDKIDDT